MLDTVLRILLPTYALLAIAVIAARRARLLKEIGYDPIVIRPLRQTEMPHDWLESILLVAVLALFADIVLNAVSPVWVSQQIAVPLLRHATAARWLGLGVVTGGLILSGAGVRRMGTSWRMGIDSRNPGALVTGGLFARMRHPIYAGMLLVASGAAAATADVLSIAAATAAWVGLPVQARLEERFMLSVHGDEYRAYMARTGRFWPAPRQTTSSDSPA